MVFWQMSHFFAIAIYRLNDYVAAGIPVLPVNDGLRITKISMIFYIIAFMAAVSMLTLLGYAGDAYLGVSSLLGFGWLVLCMKGFGARDDKAWARKMFLFSLAVLMGTFIMMSVDVVR